MYYDTNRKNPETATLNAIMAIKALTDENDKNGKHYTDIIDLRYVSSKVSKSIYTECDKLKRACFCTMIRDKWENLIWKITEDNMFSSFLEGDLSCLFEWSEYNIDSSEKYYESFKKKIIEAINKNNDQIALHESLLEYGDFQYQEGTGLGMPRYYLIKYQSEWNKGIKSHQHIRNILKRFLDDEEPNCDGTLYKMFIDKNAEKNSILGYMEYLEFLMSDSTPRHIILPRIYQSSGDNYRELMVQWVHQYYDNSWVYERDTIVLPWQIKEDSFVFLKQDEDIYYYIDIVYSWNSGNPFWSFKISSRGIDFTPHFDNLSSQEWTLSTNPNTGLYEWRKENALIDDVNKTIHERTQDVVDYITQVFNILGLKHFK